MKRIIQAVGAWLVWVLLALSGYAADFESRYVFRIDRSTTNEIASYVAPEPMKAQYLGTRFLLIPVTAQEYGAGFRNLAKARIVEADTDASRTASGLAGWNVNERTLEKTFLEELNAVRAAASLPIYTPAQWTAILEKNAKKAAAEEAIAEKPKPEPIPIEP